MSRWLARTLFAASVLLSACARTSETRKAPWAETDIATTPEPAQDAREPIVKGPCANSCAALVSGLCDWQRQCSEGQVAECGERAVPCTLAEEIALLDISPYAMELCWRDCEGLH